jgi:hypothetical protein
MLSSQFQIVISFDISLMFSKKLPDLTIGIDFAKLVANCFLLVMEW